MHSLPRARRRNLRGAIALGIAAAASVVFPAAGAHADTAAATAYVDASTDGRFHTLYYTAADGQANDVTFSHINDAATNTQIFTIDDVVPITAGNGCSYPDDSDLTVVQCTMPDSSYFHSVIAHLGDGDDTATATPGPAFTNTINGADYTAGYQIRGELGNDRLTAPPLSAAALHGGSGTDTITGGVNQHGGKGNDTMSGSSSAYGDDGDDTISGVHPKNGVEADLVGGKGNDTLIGTSDTDAIQGNQGNDLIEGNGGYDDIMGGSGNDLVRGGKGPDTLIGGPGRDRLYGNSGTDLILAGPNDDKLYGGAGNDTLHGQGGNDLLDGGSGTDKLYQN